MVGRDRVAALTCGDGGLKPAGVVAGCNVAESVDLDFGDVEKKFEMRLVFWAELILMGIDCFSLRESKEGDRGELEVKGLMLRSGMALK